MKPKVVLITGGAGDLAVELRSQLLTAGFEVEAPTHDELDVADAEAVECFIKDRERIDLLINNAGLTADNPVLKMSEADWDEAMSVNVKGARLALLRHWIGVARVGCTRKAQEAR